MPGNQGSEIFRSGQGRWPGWGAHPLHSVGGCPGSRTAGSPTPQCIHGQGQRWPGSWLYVPTGENVKAFFSRVAALAFERSVLQDLERRSSARPQVGDGDIIRTCR